MDASDTATKLASGGAYTAWFIVVALSGVIVFLYREIRKIMDKLVEAYKEEDTDTQKNLANIIKTQIEQTVVLSTILRILEGRK